MSNSDFETYLDLTVFVSLTLIDLSSNNLEIIKASYFKSNTILNVIQLSQNKIKIIELEAFLFNPYHLDLSSNRLKNISKKIFVPVHLDSFQQFKFYFSNNTIQKFDLAFDPMQHVDLRSNRLSEIPSKINTYYLDMSFNLITGIKRLSFSKMSLLTDLLISSNLIETIEAYSFAEQKWLVCLNLSSNRLTSLHDDTFYELFSLEVLDLNNNSIDNIHKSLFRHQVQLNQLFLNGNPVKFIENESFQKQNFLKFLYLDSFDPTGIDALTSRISNSTFVGLNNLRVLVLNKTVMDSLVNLNNIIVNLKPIYERQVLNRSFVRSRNVIYFKQNYAGWDCLVTLYSIRFQIQLNLYQDDEQFMNFCGQYSLTELSYDISLKMSDYL
jgi:hypothetical protein